MRLFTAVLPIVLAACSSSGTTTGGSSDAATGGTGRTDAAELSDVTQPVPDATEIDAAVPDAQAPDVAVPDAPVPDAPLPDAEVPDAPVPDAPAASDAARPDAGSADARVCNPLSLDLGTAHFLEHRATASTPVTTVVHGTGPFTCSYYFGPGHGTVPGGVTLSPSACVLTGGAGAGDFPGDYGFAVTVHDGCGKTVDVPVVFKDSNCDPAVMVTPAVWPPRIQQAATAGYEWSLDFDVDISFLGNDCVYCYFVTVGTVTPITVANMLDCNAPGTLCSSCNENACAPPTPPSCQPNTEAVRRRVTVNPHAALRSDGGPSWLTANLQLTYSGDNPSVQACGHKHWVCHLESLEQP